MSNAKLALERTKQSDDELTTTESHEFCGISGVLAVGNGRVTTSISVRRERSG